MKIAETVTIAKSEYTRLLNDSEFLGYLEACGVDNWAGWEDAIAMMDTDE